MATINLNKKPQTLTPSEMIKLNKRISGNLTRKRQLELSRAKKKIALIPTLRMFH
ncbi:hypothetical protein [Levilactobacillus brevis]|uniref:hypothetical protein n=1 Tax=Levilactobacillus brevis TaxID=1580 RepID=UPI000A4F80E2|nr:hypothetical protein [Levilactobacillus brevis]